MVAGPLRIAMAGEPESVVDVDVVGARAVVVVVMSELDDVVLDDVEPVVAKDPVVEVAGELDDVVVAALW